MLWDGGQSQVTPVTKPGQGGHGETVPSSFHDSGAAAQSGLALASVIWVICSLWPFSRGRDACGAGREWGFLGGSIQFPGLLLASFLPSFNLLLELQPSG